MKILKVMLTGVAGTVVMTAYSYYLSDKKKKQLKEPNILGTMLTQETGKAGEVSESPESLVIGNICHYAVGAGFAISYQMLWNNGIGKPDLKNGIILGLASGAIAILVWKSFFIVHPRPPEIELPLFLKQLLPAHLIFTVSTVGVYNLIKKK